jgi:glycosyltransferase involved in cell wall biosynthesis
MQGAKPEIDPDFGVEVQWDIPLLDGYSWLCLPNRSGKPRLGSFFGLFNPGIWRLIRHGNFDAVILYTGYVCATFWLAIAAAKASKTAVLFGTDAHELAPRDGKRWKLKVKKWFWPRLFRLADVALIVSSGSAALMSSLEIPEDRIVLAPFCVDNEWWVKQSDLVDRAAVRARWGVPEHAAVIFYCAKLQSWKRPQDLLRAFAKSAGEDAYLMFAGAGPLRPALELEATSLGISDRVRFLGFANQSALPELYTSSDVFVLPSEYEPFGLAVNEAMLCGCPVIVSDRVGARFDLVREGETGYVFPCGDVDGLAAILRRALNDRQRLCRIGEAARARMAGWSHLDYARALVEAVFKAVKLRGECA